ncbi:MAG: thiamine phosphate synthase, partial [Planctomycetota bacterium]
WLAAAGAGHGGEAMVRRAIVRAGTGGHATLVRGDAELRARVPVVALGGVDASNVAEVAQVGGCGAAAISAFYDAADPAETARAFRAAFG